MSRIRFRRWRWVWSRSKAACRAFFDADPWNPVIGRTMAFAVLALAQIAHTFNMRGGPLAPGAHRGSRLLPAAVLCTAMQCGVIVFPPAAELFGAQPLNAVQWLAVAAFSLAPAAVVRLENRLEARARKR